MVWTRMRAHLSSTSTAGQPDQRCRIPFKTAVRRVSQDFIKRHPYPLDRVPALCVASCDRRPNSLLKPVIDFLALRYGEWSDGCVCQVDAVLPECARVFINDMDHFGPAWPSFPATDKYDPTRLWLVCTALALSESALPPSSASRSSSSSAYFEGPTLPLLPPSSAARAPSPPLKPPNVAKHTSSPSTFCSRTSNDE
eukprot:5651144-Pleurochrysis_carterae.AAC.3